MSTTVVAINGTKSSGHYVATSPDAVTWTLQSTALDSTSGAWTSLAYSSALNLFCAVASSGSKSAVSADGVTWTTGTMPNKSWNSVCWADDLGLFVAVSSDGSAAHSADGLSWTTSTTVPEANDWHTVVWAKSLGLLCAASFSGTHQIMTSPDGITWTSRTHTLASSQGLAWDPTLGKFCTWASATNTTSLSSDGITWAAAGGTGLNGGNLHGGTYKRSGGGFVIGGHNDRVFTSSDGTTWTQQAANNGFSGDQQCITYSVALSLYIASVNTSGNQGIITSPDGATWTARTLTDADSWMAVVDSSVPAPPVKHNFGTVVC